MLCFKIKNIKFEKGKIQKIEKENPKKSKQKEKKRSYRVIKNSKPRTKEGQSINSSRIPNLVRKRKGILLQDCVQKKEVTRSLRTLDLVRKRIKVLIHEKFQTSCRKGKEYQNSQLPRISSGREFELQVRQPKILNLVRNRGRISSIIVVKYLK